jgi:hypothetical protein
VERSIASSTIVCGEVDPLDCLIVLLGCDFSDGVYLFLLGGLEWLDFGGSHGGHDAALLEAFRVIGDDSFLGGVDIGFNVGLDGDISAVGVFLFHFQRIYYNSIK